MTFKDSSSTRLRHFGHLVARSGRKSPRLLASLGIASLMSLAHSNAAWSATAPPLGSTSGYGIVSSTFTNSANPTVITGAVCYTTAPTLAPTTITDGPAKTPCDTEIADQGIALANLDSQLGSCITLGSAVDLSSVVVNGGTPGVIPPGCYTSTGAMSVGSTLTLSGAGIYVFRPGAGAETAALNTAADSIVTMDGVCANDVFWAPTAATTLGANSTFFGTIISAAGITMGAGADLSGRALAAGGTVTTDSNSITVPTCTPYSNGNVTPPSDNVTAVPTLSEWVMIALAALMAMGAFTVLRKRGS